jgi:hypothetical protein
MPSAGGARHRVDAAAYPILDFASRTAANEGASEPDRLRTGAAQSPVGTLKPLTATALVLKLGTSHPERHRQVNAVPHASN